VPGFVQHIFDSKLVCGKRSEAEEGRFKGAIRAKVLDEGFAACPDGYDLCQGKQSLENMICMKDIDECPITQLKFIKSEWR